MNDPKRPPLDMSVARLLAGNPRAVPVFLRHHMACVGCSMSAFDSLADALVVYGIRDDLFLQELQQTVLTEGGAAGSLSNDTDLRE